MSKEEPIDVRDMAIVHRTFRTAYDEAARLVRAAPVPSPERVTFLADHVDFSINMLNIHHDGEDELLYPKLIERVPDQAGMTEEVGHEHELVKTALDDASGACAGWREQPSAERGEALAESLDQLNLVSQHHLDDEEQKVVPLAAVTLSQQEWDALGKHSVARIPRNKRPIAFGMVLDPLNETDREFMLRFLPRPVRMARGILIERPWKRYVTSLRAGS
jgi:hemerythrin-like domain-containing protein